MRFYISLHYFIILVTIEIMTESIRSQSRNINNPNGIDFYTEEEFEKLDKFRARVTDGITQAYMHENKYLIRFLRAQDLNLDAAERMIRENFSWRKQKNVESLMKKNFSKWEDRYPVHYNADFQGRPGTVSSLKDLDIRRVVLGGQSEEYQKYVIYEMERGVQNLHRQSNITEKEFIEGNIVYNMAGFSPRTHACFVCVPILIEQARNFEKYYPRLAHTIIIVNVPRVFESFYQIIKPVLSPYTIKIMKLYGLDKVEWSEALLKIFPKDQLPQEFGGTAMKKHWNRILPY